MAEYYESLDTSVPSSLVPIRRFDAEKDTHIPCSAPEESKVEEPKAEKVEETPTEEAKTEGTIKLFQERAELEVLKEDEYEDCKEYPTDDRKYEITELWNCYKEQKETTELKKLHEVLRTKLTEKFSSKESIIKEIDLDTIDFQPEKDIDNVFRSRVLKPNVIADYDGDSFDYLLVYDQVSDIITRYNTTTFVAAMQIQRLDIPGLSERILFDVLLSDYFQLPKPSAHHLHYITIACIMRKRLPIQSLNVLIKKLPRMDPEIKHRFYTLFSLVMNHLDFQINFDVLKKITDPESSHYKHVQELFARLSIFTYTKKLEDIFKEKGMPTGWLTENFADPIFIHGEEEEDIKKITEKIRFKDESKEEFEQLLNGEDLEAKEDVLEEVLFEAVFRKANRNYSFMEKVLEIYADTLGTFLKNKLNVVKMMFNMFQHNRDRLVVFFELFCKHKVISHTDITEWIGSQEAITPTHLHLVYHVLQNLMEAGEYPTAVKVFEETKKITEKSTESPHANEFTVAMLRKHLKDLHLKGKYEEVKEIFKDTELWRSVAE